MRLLLDPVHAAPVLRTLPPELKRRLKNGLRRLREDPSGTTNALDIKRLDHDAGPPMYRLRIGDWRIAFTVDEDVVVLRIFHRNSGYGWLQDMP